MWGHHGCRDDDEGVSLPAPLGRPTRSPLLPAAASAGRRRRSASSRGTARQRGAPQRGVRGGRSIPSPAPCSTWGMLAPATRPVTGARSFPPPLFPVSLLFRLPASVHRRDRRRSLSHSPPSAFDVRLRLAIAADVHVLAPRPIRVPRRSDRVERLGLVGSGSGIVGQLPVWSARGAGVRADSPPPAGRRDNGEP